MKTDLNDFERLQLNVACDNCQYYRDGFCINKDKCFWINLKEDLETLRKYEFALKGKRLTDTGSQLMTEVVYGDYGTKKIEYEPEYVAELYAKLRNIEDIYSEAKNENR